MPKIVSVVALTAGLLIFNAPAQASSACAYAITKLEAQIKYEKTTKDTAPASAAAAEAAAYDAKTATLSAKGASADAALSDTACRKAVIKGWKALHG